jgi:hypothetical protein
MRKQAIEKDYVEMRKRDQNDMNPQTLSRMVTMAKYVVASIVTNHHSESKEDAAFCVLVIEYFSCNWNTSPL